MKSLFGSTGYHSQVFCWRLIQLTMLPIKDNQHGYFHRFPSQPSSASAAVSSLAAHTNRLVPLPCVFCVYMTHYLINSSWFWQLSRGRSRLHTSGRESSTRRRGTSWRATPRRSTTVGPQIPATFLQTARSPKYFCFRTRREDQREHRTVERVPLRWDVSSPRVQPTLRLRRRWRLQAHFYGFSSVKTDLMKSLLVHNPKTDCQNG